MHSADASGVVNVCIWRSLIAMCLSQRPIWSFFSEFYTELVNLLLYTCTNFQSYDSDQFNTPCAVLEMHCESF